MAHPTTHSAYAHYHQPHNITNHHYCNHHYSTTNTNSIHPPISIRPIEYSYPPMSCHPNTTIHHSLYHISTSSHPAICSMHWNYTLLFLSILWMCYNSIYEPYHHCIHRIPYTPMGGISSPIHSPSMAIVVCLCSYSYSPRYLHNTRYAGLQRCRIVSRPNYCIPNSLSHNHSYHESHRTILINEHRPRHPIAKSPYHKHQMTLLTNPSYGIQSYCKENYLRAN